MIDQRIGFIGAGQMAVALARGFLRAELTTADRLLIFFTGVFYNPLVPFNSFLRQLSVV